MKRDLPAVVPHAVQQRVAADQLNRRDFRRPGALQRLSDLSMLPPSAGAERWPLDGILDAYARHALDMCAMVERTFGHRARSILPMSDTQQLFSPNQQFFLLLRREEIRMSHWITSATLWEAASERAVLALGNPWWSTEQVVWSDDSTCVTVELRRYPGDVPALWIAIAPGQRSIRLHLPTGVAAIPFDALDQALETYYQQHTRTALAATKRR
jgi:hypothetical protein